MPTYYPEKRQTPEQNQIGSLRLISPWAVKYNGWSSPGPTAPMRVGRNNAFYYGDTDANSSLKADEYLVRIGAHLFATRYMKQLKSDWWKDFYDIIRFYQFLIKMSDLSMGALVVDDNVFTANEQQNFIVALEWPPHGCTNMGGKMGGYWSVFKALTNDITEVGDPGKVGLGRGVYPLPSTLDEIPLPTIKTDIAALHDPRNQDDLLLPTGVRIPYGYTKLKKIQAMLASFDWSDRDGDTYLEGAEFNSGYHVDGRFGAAAMCYAEMIPGQQPSNIPSTVYGIQHPTPFPILTKRAGSRIRPVSGTDIQFNVSLLSSQATNLGDSHTFGSAAGAGGHYPGMGEVRGLRIRITNTSGNTLSLRGIIPLKSFSWIHKMFTLGGEYPMIDGVVKRGNSIYHGINSEVKISWDSWFYGSSFGGRAK